jgi:hypothetical protein
MSTKLVEHLSSVENYDFPDLKFYTLEHKVFRLGIIEAFKLQDNSVNYQLLYVNSNPHRKIVNYYGNISLYTELSKKFRNTYNSLHNNLSAQTKKKLVHKVDIANSGKKKLIISSPLASVLLKESSFSLAPTQPSVVVKSKPSNKLDILLKLREEINM